MESKSEKQRIDWLGVANLAFEVAKLGWQIYQSVHKNQPMPTDSEDSEPDSVDINAKRPGLDLAPKAEEISAPSRNLLELYNSLKAKQEINWR